LVVKISAVCIARSVGMEKTKMDYNFACKLKFWEHFFCIILAIILIGFIVTMIVMWISGIVAHLVQYEFSEAFCWFVVGPMIVAIGACFIAACGDMGDGW